MCMAALNPYMQYQQQSVMTMTHGEMLTRLYEGAIKHLNIAVRNFTKDKRGSKDTIDANSALRRAQQIIQYLNETLDKKYAVSKDLARLYEFFNRQIMKSLIDGDPKPIQEIIPLIEDLKDTFIQADKIARMERTTPASRLG